MDPRYPIGDFAMPASVTPALRQEAIQKIAETPTKFRAAVKGLSESQLHTPYRDGGWTIRQVVHHVPDSHMNTYVRVKLAVTEDTPAIKGYDEGRWAELPDARSAPVALSLDLLEALHRRWVLFLRRLSDQDFLKAYVHPELGKVPLYEVVAMYAWHGRHHAAHIRHALQRMS